MTEDVKKAILALRDSISQGFGLVGDMKCSSIAILLKDLSEELEQVKRERDAAVEDLLYAGSLDGEFCSICRYSEHESCEKRKFQHEHCWQWRGPCAENGGAEDE